MSIAEEFHFDKDGEVVRNDFRTYLKRYFGTALVLLVAFLGYGVGKLEGNRRPGVSINFNPAILSEGTSTGSGKVAVSSQTSSESVYASAKGTKYYYASCKSTIAVKNRVSFASAGAAEAAGYSLASTCKP